MRSRRETSHTGGIADCTSWIMNSLAPLDAVRHIAAAIDSLETDPTEDQICQCAQAICTVCIQRIDGAPDKDDWIALRECASRYDGLFHLR